MLTSDEVIWENGKKGRSTDFFYISGIMTGFFSYSVLFFPGNKCFFFQGEVMREVTEKL